MSLMLPHLLDDLAGRVPRFGPVPACEEIRKDLYMIRKLALLAAGSAVFGILVWSWFFT